MTRSSSCHIQRRYLALGLCCRHVCSDAGQVRRSRFFVSDFVSSEHQDWDIVAMQPSFQYQHEKNAVIGPTSSNVAGLKHVCLDEQDGKHITTVSAIDR